MAPYRNRLARILIVIILGWCAPRAAAVDVAAPPAAAVDAAASPGVELRQLEAAVREAFRHDVDRELEVAALDARFDALLAPYADGRPRDDFWLAAATSLLEWCDRRRSQNGYDAWADRLQIAEFLATQAPSSAAAAARYSAFVRECVTTQGFSSGATFAPWLVQLDLAAKVTPSTEERAWFAVAAACLQREMLRAAIARSAGRDEIANLRRSLPTRWRTARESARGTRWSGIVESGAFLARLADGSADAPDATALRTEIAGLKDTLRTDPASPENRRVVVLLEWLEPPDPSPGINLATVDSYPPGTKMVFAYGVSGAHAVQFELFRFSAEEWVRTGDRDFWNTNPAARKPIEAWSVPVPGGEDGGWYGGSGRLPAGLAPGFYLLRATVDPAGLVQARSCFLVTVVGGTALVASTGASEAFLHLTKSGAPLAGATVHGMFSFEGKPPVAWEGTTDADGRIVGLPQEDVPKAEFEQVSEWVTVNRNRRSRSLAVDTPAGPAQLSWAADNTHRAASDLDLIVERTACRPGEIVHWKAIARDRLGNRCVLPPASSSLRLWVAGPSGVIVDNQRSELDAAGSATGEFLVPQTVASPGEINIQASRKGADAQSNWSARQGISVEVPTPGARIEISGDPVRQRPGGELEASVHATDRPGAPAAGAEVEFAFACPARAAAEGATAAEFAAWKRKIANEPEKVRTDAAGVAVAHLALPAFLRDATWVRVYATVRLKGSEAMRLASAAPVASRNALAWMSHLIEPEAAEPGKPTEARWMVVDAAGRPRAIRGEVWLYERRTAKASTPKNTLAVGAGLADVFVEKQGVRTASDGRVSAQLVPPHIGTFVARLMIDGQQLLDDCEQPERAIALFRTRDATATTAAPTSAYLPAGKAPRPDFRLDAPTATRPDQPLSFGITVPRGERVCWLTVAGEQSVVVRRVQLAGRSSRVLVDNPPSGRKSLQASLYDANGFNKQTVDIPVQRETATMAIEFEPAKDAAAGANRRVVRVRVRDAKNAPLAADVAVVVTDDVQTAPGDDPWPPELAFDGGSRPVEMRFPAETPAQPAPKAFPSVSRSEMLTDRANQTLQGLPWLSEADRDNTRSSPFLVGRPEPDNGFNLVLSPFADASSNASLFENLKRANSTAGSAKRPPSRVPSTALWAPSLRTDAQGDATVELDLPSQPSRWRIKAFAAGIDGDSFVRGTKIVNGTPQ